jgi:hypothetical protein
MDFVSDDVTKKQKTKPVSLTDVSSEEKKNKRYPHLIKGC